MRLFINAINNAGKPAAFLDRDGTINRNRRGEYITKPEQFELYDGTIDALRLITEKGYQIIVISNHSGIGRGYMSMETAKEINGILASRLIKAGIALSGIYICPHLPDEGCSCRKPKDGLLREAANELKANLGQSFIAGDSSGDLKLADAANLPGYLVLTGAGRHTAKKHLETGKFGTLLSLAKYLPFAKEKND